MTSRTIRLLFAVSRQTMLRWREQARGDQCPEDNVCMLARNPLEKLGAVAMTCPNVMLSETGLATRNEILRHAGIDPAEM